MLLTLQIPSWLGFVFVGVHAQPRCCDLQSSYCVPLPAASLAILVPAVRSGGLQPHARDAAAAAAAAAAAVTSSPGSSGCVAQQLWVNSRRKGERPAGQSQPSHPDVSKQERSTRNGHSKLTLLQSQHRASGSAEANKGA